VTIDTPVPALLENLLHEHRLFPPDPEFAAQATAQPDLYQRAKADRLAFWANQARELLDWDTPFTEVLDWSHAPVARWFADGRLNACANAVDRHVAAGRGERVALYFEGEPGDSRTLTYADLYREVQRAANALVGLGVGLGDRVAIYLPMIPEAVIAMLACARIGALHSVVFGGFSAEALRSRIEDAEACLVITADGGFRKGRATALKPAVDEALAKGCPSVRNVIVVLRTGQDVDWIEGRDVWWHEALRSASPEHTAVAVEAEHPLFILYTSGTTGRPKGIFHTTGGYLTQVAFTHRAVFDLKPETDVYWCTADVGWVTGHSYVVYGPLINGASQVIYEGTPDTPHQGRWWEVIAKYGVTILYTAPTAIRTVMKWGEQIPARHDLSSLRLLGSVGEPINPEAWIWYRRVIGGNRTPVVDTWWQTETGAIMISPLPGITSAKPGSAMTPLPGVSADVIDDAAQPVPLGGGGYLVLTEPWPAMLRGIWGDDERFIEIYLVALPRPLLRRRRCEARRGRRPVAARPGRRRDEHLRPPAVHRRDRVGARLAPDGRRGGRGGCGGRPDRSSGGRVRHPACRGGRGSGPRARHRARRRDHPASARHQGDRRDRTAAHHPRRGRAAEDALRKDHAALAS